MMKLIKIKEKLTGLIPGADDTKVINIHEITKTILIQQPESAFIFVLYFAEKN